nr:hypothetical protein [Chitinophaga agrisoli]
MATLREMLHTLEKALGVYGKYISTQLRVKQTTYSSWKTGQNKNCSISVYEKFKEIFGIDLYQSLQKDVIFISDAKKLSKEQYEVLVTNGPVKIERLQ